LERAEYRLLCRAVGEACRLLADGDFGAGYHCLKAGLEHAEELARSGNEWANGLAQSYRSALAEYTELTPVSRLSSSTPAERPAPPSRPSCSSR
jgi:hypothetical protein